MREILFKAKRIDNSEWVEGYLIKDLHEEEWYIGFLFGGGAHDTDVVQINPDTICQYTGLTDKNGNKIWENDIVKDDVVFGSVVWDKKYVQFMINDEFDGNQDYSDWWQEVEVIGNVFDNPELINRTVV